MADIESKLLDYLKTKANLVYLEIDTQGVVSFANLFAERLCALRLQHKHYRELFVGHDDLNLDDLAKREEPIMLNITSKRTLAQTYYFRFFKQGVIYYVIGQENFEEIESLKSSLLSMNTSLNHMTRELQKKSIELNKLNELKNHFLGITAHDLRNPLGVIRGYAEFIATNDHSAPTKTRDIANKIIESSDFVMRLLDDLRDMSKIEASKLDLDLSVHDAKEMLNHSLSSNRVLANKKNIRISMDFHDNKIKIRCDRDKFLQVIDHLLDNAIKFSDHGKHVTVAAFSAQSHLTVRVKDEGPGIPTALLHHVFKEQNIEKPVGDRDEKSNIHGLAACKKIIVAHGGSIWGRKRS